MYSPNAVQLFSRQKEVGIYVDNGGQVIFMNKRVKLWNESETYVLKVIKGRNENLGIVIRELIFS